jgi:hypothetical protein
VVTRTGGTPSLPKLKKWPVHVINGEDLMGLLKRANEGEDSGLLYLELYVNGRPEGKSNYEPDPKPVKKPKKGKK